MPNKVILLVDDRRIFSVARQSPVRIARSSQAGLALLQEYKGGRIDELWLDHDLGLVDTIMPVVEHLILDKDEYSIHRIYVHTANDDGADSMMRLLHKAGYTVYRTRVKGLLKNATGTN